MTQRNFDKSPLSSSTISRLRGLRPGSLRAYRGHGPGEQSGRSAGSGLEWRDLRPYTPGDDLRHLDWNLYARHESLHIKERIREEAVPILIILDDSASMSMGLPNKWDRVRELTLALSHVAHANSSPLELFATSAENPSRIQRFAPTARTPQQVQRWFENLEPSGLHSPANALKQLGSGRHRPRFTLLLTDGYEKELTPQALRILSHRGHEISTILIHAPEEIEPTLHGNLELIDEETQEVEHFSITEQEVELYRKEMSAWIQDWRQFCLEHHLKHVHHNTGTSLAQLLFQDLIRAGILR
ncbi:MAG: DUF58 domain-containing protein [Planctomycetota bacterium]|nr:DUF58 domain-containing protein [Planctomycetota bacterium]